jgi:flavin-dependent dehydrogenase
MARVVIGGAGWAGCAAAVVVTQAGGEAVLVEKTDTLLGTGQVGGIFRNNGRFTAAEEVTAMGGGALFQLMDDASLHQNMEFPGHKHSSLYDVAVMEPRVRRFLQDKGVEIWVRSRVTGVIKDDGSISALQLEGGLKIEGDAFLDTTGTAGSIPNCRKYGNGCAECVLRCVTFGNRISITAKAGVQELMGRRADGSIGPMSGSCKLHSGSVDIEVAKEL